MAVTYEHHIGEDHNLWHYLYFIVYLQTKDRTEFTGPESYVHRMIAVRGGGQCSWLAVCVGVIAVYMCTV